jgi:acetyltransferase-like isoleucine patch superfamily enzyme
VEVIDRPLLNVGDFVVVGHHAKMCSHFIIPKQGESGLRLYTAPIQLGEHSFIGACVNIGPGVTVLPRSLLKYGFVCWPDQTYDGTEKT